MPELPEVETSRRGIAPHLTGRVVSQVVIRQPRLRWPIPLTLRQALPGQRLHAVGRRGKYLLLEFDQGWLILHLGMSGSLRVLEPSVPAGKHDHFDLYFDNLMLRLNDPRRFGAVLWTSQDPTRHRLLHDLGPEPLSADFDGQWLYQRSRNRRQAVKPFIMDSKVVVGVGNIYANEALFAAGIDPRRASGRISLKRYQLLAEHIKQVLVRAIEQGGTTLNDFVQADGQPGYFVQQLMVYGRAGQPCAGCGCAVRRIELGQRSTYFCARCQR